SRRRKDFWTAHRAVATAGSIRQRTDSPWRTISPAESYRDSNPCWEVIDMLYWAAVFLVIALVAALLGFGGIAAAAAGVAKFLFFLFLVMFLIFLILGISVGRKVV